MKKKDGNNIIKTDYVYSIDKAKIEFQYLKTDVIQTFLNRFSYSPKSDNYYLSNSINKCHYNFVIENESGTIYLGVEPNWHFGSLKSKSIVLEYNPNKINPFKLDEFKFLKGYPRVLIRILSFDIAVDIPKPYNRVFMLKRDARERFAIFGSRYTETRYLGSMGHNHVKLYDKAIEQGVNFNWTRFEITIKKINSLSATLDEFQECVKLPDLYYIENQLKGDDLKLNDIQRIVLESIIRDVNLLYTIKEYRTRLKYTNLIHSLMQNLNVNANLMYRTYNNYSLNFDNMEGEIPNEMDIHTYMLEHNAI